MFHKLIAYATFFCYNDVKESEYTMEEIKTKEELFAYIKGLEDRFTALEESIAKETPADPPGEENKEDGVEVTVDEEKEIDEISKFLGY